MSSCTAQPTGCTGWIRHIHGNVVVKVTIYMIDLDLFEGLNSIYAQYFGESKPARACVEVMVLPKGAALEMDAIALVPAP